MVAGRRGTGAQAIAAEPELIMAATSGDHEAFRLLYEQNVAAIYRFATARVGRNDADDVTAETFSKAWRALESYQWTGKPLIAWLYRIAANVIASQRRRVAVGERATQRAAVNVGEELFDEAVVSAIDADSLGQVVRELPERQRLVLELRIVRQLSVAEVADLMAITEGATRALTHRALTALRRTSVVTDRRSS